MTQLGRAAGGYLFTTLGVPGSQGSSSDGSDLGREPGLVAEECGPRAAEHLMSASLSSGEGLLGDPLLTA